MNYEGFFLEVLRRLGAYWPGDGEAFHKSAFMIQGKKGET